MSGAAVRERSRSSRAQDVGQDVRLVGGLAASAQLQRATLRADLRRRNDENLHVGVGADHRADVAAVEHRAGRRCGERALEVEQCGTHLRHRRHHRSRFADLIDLERRFIEFAPDRAPCAAAMAASRSAGLRPASSTAFATARYKQPGVEMAQPVMRGEPLAERALARRRRPVDRNDHEKSAPSARIRSVKPGKLVAMKAASSTATACSLARPITSADMAMR